MSGTTDRKTVPADLARAGEARQFIAWRGAVAGLRDGRLGDLAVAAEAVLTDILLSTGEGMLEIDSEHDAEKIEVRISHPRLTERRMGDLRGILEKFLDGHEIEPCRTLLVKYIEEPR